jgi:hypothetical protein
MFVPKRKRGILPQHFKYRSGVATPLRSTFFICREIAGSDHLEVTNQTEYLVEEGTQDLVALLLRKPSHQFFEQVNFSTDVSERLLFPGDGIVRDTLNNSDEALDFAVAHGFPFVDSLEAS